jgi:hypothetical protein
MISKSDLMGASEVRELLGVSNKTLARYRQKHWQEGIHFVAPVQRVLYVRPMLMDWLLNHKGNPRAHNDAMARWVAEHQTPRQRRKAS